MSNFQDRFEIAELIDRWSDAGAEKDYGAMADLLTEDAVWQAGEPNVYRAEGRETILATIKGIAGSMTFLQQTPLTKVIRVDGNTASARTAIHEIYCFEDGTGTQIYSNYHDKFVKTAEGWKFKERFFAVRLINNKPPEGELFPPQKID